MQRTTIGSQNSLTWAAAGGLGSSLDLKAVILPRNNCFGIPNSVQGLTKRPINLTFRARLESF